MTIKVDTAFGAFCLLLAAAAWFHTADLAPASRGIPRLAIILLTLTSLTLVVRSLFFHRRTDGRTFTVNPKMLLFAVSVIAIYATGIGQVGFFVSTSFLIPVIAVAMGDRNITRLAVSTVVYLIFLYLVFVVGLSVPLPPELPFIAQ